MGSEHAIIEIVPNMSEGRNRRTIESIASHFTSGDDVWLLDVHSDPSHHRSVLTAAARPEAVPSAVLRLARKCIDSIDLTRHRGEHPRMGALDVVPFVPLGAATRETAVGLAREVGRELASAFELPVFLYGEAATAPERRELSDIRRLGFRELAPDFGPSSPHPTAGATAVSAREILIAFNVNLAIRDVTVARSIARKIRASNGGLPQLKALGFELEERGLTQVSMNLTDFRVTGIERAFLEVSREAERSGIRLAGSELVGLIPRAARFENMERVLGLARPAGTIEDRLMAAGAPTI